MRCIFSYIHENKVTVSLSKCRQCYLILLKGIRKEDTFFLNNKQYVSENRREFSAIFSLCISFQLRRGEKPIKLC